TYTSNWWAKVTYNGREGYVSRAYLRIPTGQPNVPECHNPGGGGNSRINGPISRAEVLARAQTWVDRRVPYSMYSTASDPQGKAYRSDCSGFVSMALHLDQSLSTVTLPGRVHQISKDELRPGDIVGNLGPGTGGANGHVVIFAGWVDGSRTKFRTLEQTPDYAQSRVLTWGSRFYLHAAYRYNNISD
ncbi:C40 family peptidase, partial [Tessaracoccus sp. OH4464_COT-324]|uniref:C40 family peptidase n=1 Tax=Tessaracoccus sp. OH4464_COT-324 TaxID=2491059 RepID=UPI0018F3B65E